jgi:hypothetical protein
MNKKLRVFLIVVLAFVLVFALVACKTEKTLTLQATATVEEGATVTLDVKLDDAAVTEADAANITWTSADPTKVTVDKGVITGVAETAANAPVVVSAKFGEQTKECKVTVTAPAPEETFGLELKGFETVSATAVRFVDLDLDENKNYQIEAEFSAPADFPADDKGLVYTSSSTAIATVDVAGRVTAVAPGLVIITVETEEEVPEKPIYGAMGQVTGTEEGKMVASLAVRVGFDEATKTAMAGFAGTYTATDGATWEAAFTNKAKDVWVPTTECSGTALSMLGGLVEYKENAWVLTQVGEGQNTDEGMVAVIDGVITVSVIGMGPAPSWYMFLPEGATSHWYNAVIASTVPVSTNSKIVLSDDGKLVQTAFQAKRIDENDLSPFNRQEAGKIDEVTYNGLPAPTKAAYTKVEVTDPVTKDVTETYYVLITSTTMLTAHTSIWTIVGDNLYIVRGAEVIVADLTSPNLGAELFPPFYGTYFSNWENFVEDWQDADGIVFESQEVAAPVA